MSQPLTPDVFILLPVFGLQTNHSFKALMIMCHQVWIHPSLLTFTMIWKMLSAGKQTESMVTFRLNVLWTMYCLATFYLTGVGFVILFVLLICQCMFSNLRLRLRFNLKTNWPQWYSHCHLFHEQPSLHRCLGHQTSPHRSPPTADIWNTVTPITDKPIIKDPKRTLEILFFNVGFTKKQTHPYMEN